MPLTTVLSRPWVAPSLLEYGDVNLMGSVTPSFPKSSHVFKDMKFEFDSDFPVFCLFSPSIPLQLGLNEVLRFSWRSGTLPKMWPFPILLPLLPCGLVLSVGM